MKNINLKSITRLAILWILIALFYQYGPISDKPFSELSSFNQYKSCEQDRTGWTENDYLLSALRKNYDLMDILVVEFQVSWIIFGIEQDFYLENGLDCSFQKRLSFSEALEEGLGSMIIFFLRRLASLSSYICIFLIFRYSYMQLTLIKVLSKD